MILASSKTVLVVGPGALGTALASELSEHGFQVRCLGRHGSVGLMATVEMAKGVIHLDLPAPDAAWLSRVPLAFVAVKAFDLEAALRQTSKALGDGAHIVSVANGAVSGLVKAQQLAAPHQVFRFGFSTIGVSEVGERHFAIRAKTGEVSFGPLSGGSVSEVEQAVTDASTWFGWHTGIAKAAERKWIYNVVINSLTAARGLHRNGDLMHDVPTLAAVFSEACELAVSLWGSLPLERRELYHGLEQLIARTADNENSMARDKRLGRPTESAYLAGLAQDARRFPLLTDLHAACR